jgi:DHA1 family multidrug resistance protein-like MFS transporter
MLVRKSGRWASRKLSVTHGILKLLANLYSIFVSGFGFGPLIWGPFSELFGRMVPLLVGFFIFAIFQIPVAVARNVETIMICRFLQGLAGCAPLAVVGGALADIWDPIERGVAVSIFSAATFIGPVAGLSLIIH